jgi:hypothetical protein
LISYPVLDCHFDTRSKVFAHYSIQGELPIRTYFKSNTLFQLSRQSIEDDLKWQGVDFTSAALQWDEFGGGGGMARQLISLKQAYLRMRNQAIDECERKIADCPLERPHDSLFEDQFHRFAEELRISTFRTHGIHSDLAFHYNQIHATPESTVVLVGGARELLDQGDFRRVPLGGYHSRDRDDRGNFYGINLRDERVLILAPRPNGDPGIQGMEGLQVLYWDDLLPEAQQLGLIVHPRSRSSIDSGAGRL